MAAPPTPAPAPGVVIAVRDVHTRRGGAVIHEGVTLDVRRGKIFALVGPSGCGKTLLLRQTLALQLPDSGCSLLVQQVLDAGSQASERALQVGDVNLEDVPVQVGARLEPIEGAEAADKRGRPVGWRGDESLDVKRAATAWPSSTRGQAEVVSGG